MPALGRIRAAALSVSLAVAVVAGVAAVNSSASAQTAEQTLPFPVLGARDYDKNSTTLGVQFVPRVAGTIVGVKFYRVDTANKATTVQLWGAGSAPLASASGVPMSTGWVRANFTTPIPVAAGQTYIASYFAPGGNYTTRSQGWSAARSSGDLSAPVGAGLYAWGSSASKPTQLYQNEDHDVTPVFVADPPASPSTTPAPTTTSVPPTDTSTPAPTTDPATTPPTTSTTPPPTTSAPPPNPGDPPAQPGRLPRANADNTGPRVSTFTPASGDITTDGAVIEGKVYNSMVTVTASNVTIRDSKFNGGLLLALDNNTTVEYSDITDGIAISSSSSPTVRNTEIHGGGDLIDVTSDRGRMATNVMLDTIWAHDPTDPLPSHVDGIQIRGVQGLTLKGCDLDLGTFQDSENAAWFPEDANGGNTGVSVVDCWMNGGGYTFRYATNTVRGAWTVTGLRIRNDYNWGPVYDPSQGGPPTTQADNWVQAKDGTWAPITLK